MLFVVKKMCKKYCRKASTKSEIVTVGRGMNALIYASTERAAKFLLCLENL